MPSLLTTDMSCVLRLTGRVLLMGGLLLLLGACMTNEQRTPTQQDVTPGQTEISEVPGWRYVRFRLRRNGREVNSYLDPLIANQIVAPVLNRHEGRIGLWRFHRRWPRDATGHQFSFIFLAPGPVADAVSREIQLAPELARLRADGHLLEFRVDEADPDRASDPAATSDRSWPPDIQREWPKFIMGASRMWLGLVQSEVANHQDLSLYARYQAVEAALEQTWFEEANHAFFHHLSALFGYKPVQVRAIRKDVMSF